MSRRVNRPRGESLTFFGIVWLSNAVVASPNKSWGDAIRSALKEIPKKHRAEAVELFRKYIKAAKEGKR